MKRKMIDFEQEWEDIEKAITKLKRILEGEPESFNVEEHILIYTNVYNMCTSVHSHNCHRQLYDKYRASYEEYITSTVMPSLREKHDELMLRELVKRWENHKVMVVWLARFFLYLDKYFIPQKFLKPLKELGHAFFHDLVLQELNGKVRDAVISLIGQEREGEQIDQALLKNVLDIFVEARMKEWGSYEKDFEAAFLKDTAEYYSLKASKWILDYSYPDYILKAEECLKSEKDRVSHYLHSHIEPQLLEIVQHELFSECANQLIENEHSGFLALLKDDKVEEFSRMFRLIPQGLDLMSSLFKQHVTAVGTALVKEAEDAASNKADKRDVSCLQNQVYLMKVIELHDKYLAYVNDCLQNHTLLHKAFNDAFEVCSNKLQGCSRKRKPGDFDRFL